MARVSDKNYGWQTQFGEKDQEHHAQMVLYLVRELGSKEPIGTRHFGHYARGNCFATWAII
jgi:hypothetical protein